MSFVVKVNYNEPIEQMVNAGHYDGIDIRINGENFPLNRTGVVDIKLGITRFNYRIYSDSLLSSFTRRGYRPANIAELLAFGASYPSLQFQFWIVALGSLWIYPANEIILLPLDCYPRLSGHRGHRFLGIEEDKGSWQPYYRFLITRSV